MVSDETKWLTLKEAGGVVKELTGRQPCYETLRQWASGGRRGVVLASKFIGGVIYTTERDIAAFINSYNVARRGVDLPGRPNLKESQRAYDRVMALLDRQA